MKNVLVVFLLLCSGCSLAKGEHCLTDEEYNALHNAVGEKDEAIRDLVIKIEELVKGYNELKKS